MHHVTLIEWHGCRVPEEGIQQRRFVAHTSRVSATARRLTARVHTSATFDSLVGVARRWRAALLKPTRVITSQL